MDQGWYAGGGGGAGADATFADMSVVVDQMSTGHGVVEDNGAGGSPAGSRGGDGHGFHWFWWWWWNIEVEFFWSYGGSGGSGFVLLDIKLISKHRKSNWWCNSF